MQPFVLRHRVRFEYMPRGMGTAPSRPGRARFVVTARFASARYNYLSRPRPDSARPTSSSIKLPDRSEVSLVTTTVRPSGLTPYPRPAARVSNAISACGVAPFTGTTKICVDPSCACPGTMRLVPSANHTMPARELIGANDTARTRCSPVVTEIKAMPSRRLVPSDDAATAINRPSGEKTSTGSAPPTVSPDAAALASTIVVLAPDRKSVTTPSDVEYA